jgi:hypothetical protein
VKNNNLADFLLSGLRGFLYEFFSQILNGEEIFMLRYYVDAYSILFFNLKNLAKLFNAASSAAPQIPL